MASSKTVFIILYQKDLEKTFPDLACLFPLSRNQMNRCSLKDKGLADLIFQETQVREVHEFFFIDKDDKGWWLGCHLGRVEDFEAFSFICRCWVDSNGIHNDIVQDS